MPRLVRGRYLWGRLCGGGGQAIKVEYMPLYNPTYPFSVWPAACVAQEEILTA